MLLLRMLRMLLMVVVMVAGNDLRLLLLVVVVEHLLRRLDWMIGGGRRSSGLNCERSRGSSTSLHTELTHPVDHAAVVVATSSITSTASILCRLQAALQSLLQLPTEFLSIRPEVEEVVALLQRQSFLLGQS